MARIALQLYSINDVDDDLLTVLETVSETAFDGVEFAGVEGETSEIATTLEETGLEAPSAHVGIEQLEDDLEGTLETYEELGVTELVVPYLPPEDFETRERIEETAERLSAVTAGLGEGQSLHYHNHDHEFVEVDGRPALEHLIDLTDDLQIEPDLGWVGVAGYDPVAFLETHADRVSLVHIKDYQEGGQPVEGGTGDLDIEAVSAAAQEAGAEWLIYEHEERQDSYETVENGAAYLEPYRG
ncbi:sugar phosphate isomerase/epimerase family protein [Natronobiforma cellulositropha]|uniref:sugar phosphate isomerase/epimerase family protein n=1 Tax=Natronobiforma cellulositropha TaxID=1679076 RepID=UPI0021D5D4A5|nr:sugar phosphate isomerase/epimerase [Natronobiforma cellulositropha]